MIQWILSGGDFMKQGLLFALAGYLSGSILYARVFSGILRRGDVTAQSRDGNPGTANAFLYGGFWCGTLTLICELLKGFIPVFLFTHQTPPVPMADPLTSLVIAAPVIGHVFPLFFRFRGGKGIAVTFGCLLGLWPWLGAFRIFATAFLLFSTVLRICPHYYRTIVTYVCTAAAICLSSACPNPGGFLIITAVVVGKLLTSKEKREKCQVKPLWMR